MIKKIRKLFSKDNSKMLKFKAEFQHLLEKERRTNKRFALDEENLYPCCFIIQQKRALTGIMFIILPGQQESL